MGLIGDYVVEGTKSEDLHEQLCPIGWRGWVRPRNEAGKVEVSGWGGG